MADREGGRTAVARSSVNIAGAGEEKVGRGERLMVDARDMFGAGQSIIGRDGDLTVRGYVSEGFESVAEAALSNLTSGADLGFRTSVIREGQVLVDIWGGFRDRERKEQYGASDLQMVFSVSKGVLALCLALLVERGQLDLDAPVASYWPQFGTAGKGNVRVSELLNHQAGLPVFDRPVSVAQLTQWSARVEHLTEQRPLWRPGSRHGYHAVTIGFLAGELLRQVSGLSPREFFETNIAAPLGLDAWFGVPASELTRVVSHIEAPAQQDLADMANLRRAAAPSYASTAVTNPPVDIGNLDIPAIWSAEVPALSLVADALSLARCFSVAVPGPARLISGDTLDRILGSRASGRDEVLLDQPTAFAGMFMVGSSREPMLGPTSFGHNGLAGALAFADRDTGISFAYIGNRSDPSPTPHARITRLTSALRSAL